MEYFMIRDFIVVNILSILLYIKSSVNLYRLPLNSFEFIKFFFQEMSFIERYIKV